MLDSVYDPFEGPTHEQDFFTLDEVLEKTLGDTTFAFAARYILILDAEIL